VWFGELLRHAPDEAELLIERLKTADPGIQTVYDAMLDGVSGESRMLVGAVCQLPAPVAESDLRRIIGCKSGKLHESIRELEQRSLIMKREGGWQPRHPFVKQYWQQPAGDPGELAERVIERSQIRVRLLDWASKLLEENGGELNWDGYDVLESRWTNLGYLMRQLKDAESPDDRQLFLRLWDSADTFLWTKARWRERLALGRAAETISRDIGDKRALGKALYESIAEVLWHLYGPSDEVSGYLDEAADLFDDVGDIVHRARVEWYRSRILAQRGVLQAAMTAAVSALLIAEKSADMRTIGLAHHGVGNVYRRLRQPSEALEQFEIAHEYFVRAVDSEMVAVAKRRIGCVRMHEGDLGQALLDLQTSTDQLRGLGLPGEAAESAVFHAQALAMLGEYRDAARERDIAAAVLEPIGSSVRNEEIAETTRLIDGARSRSAN
jgi:tetratricopeptide (TPR) repeat protein